MTESASNSLCAPFSGLPRSSGVASASSISMSDASSSSEVSGFAVEVITRFLFCVAHMPRDNGAPKLVGEPTRQPSQPTHESCD